MKYTPDVRYIEYLEVYFLCTNIKWISHYFIPQRSYNIATERFYRFGNIAAAVPGHDRTAFDGLV